MRRWAGRHRYLHLRCWLCCVPLDVVLRPRLFAGILWRAMCSLWQVVARRRCLQRKGHLLRWRIRNRDLHMCHRKCWLVVPILVPGWFDGHWFADVWQWRVRCKQHVLVLAELPTELERILRLVYGKAVWSAVPGRMLSLRPRALQRRTVRQWALHLRCRILGCLVQP